jgi:hypothetical protein
VCDPTAPTEAFKSIIYKKLNYIYKHSGKDASIYSWQHTNSLPHGIDSSAMLALIS